MCGFNYGAKRYERVVRGFWFCVKVSTGVLFLLSVLGWIFAPHLITLFRAEDAAVIEIGTRTLRLQCLSFPLLGWVILCNMLLQNIAMTVRASVVAAARQGLFFIPLALILPQICGLFGVQLCQPISDALAFVLSLALTLPILTKLSRLPSES